MQYEGPSMPDEVQQVVDIAMDIISVVEAEPDRDESIHAKSPEIEMKAPPSSQKRSTGGPSSAKDEVPSLAGWGNLSDTAYDRRAFDEFDRDLWKPDRSTYSIKGLYPRKNEPIAAWSEQVGMGGNVRTMVSYARHISGASNELVCYIYCRLN